MHLARDPPVKSGRIDDDGKVGPPSVTLRNQLVKESVYFWKLAEDLSNTNNSQVIRIDDGIAPRIPHALPAYAEEFERGLLPAQFLYQLRSIHFAGGFSGRNQDT
jgi:hypothetical protein